MTNSLDRIKRALAGSKVGNSLERIRSTWSLATASTFDVGCLANDVVAINLLIGLGAMCRRFVDIGGHIGSVGGSVMNLSRETQVTFIEAMPDKVKFLRSKFPAATVIECAVGECNGRVAFYIDDKASGYSTLAADASKRRIEVDLRKVDDCVDGADVVKIDIEGAELGALRGGIHLVESCRPLVMFESAPGAGDKLGYSLEEMYDFWSKRQYGIWVPNRLPHDGPPLTLEGFVEAHAYPRRCTNYFAVALEKRLEVRDASRRLVGVAM